MTQVFGICPPELEALRLNMWTKVAQRRHTVLKVFPAGLLDAPDASSSDTGRRNVLEFMLFGKVDYLLRSGAQRSTVEWAGYGAVSRRTEADAWKFTYYRVYLQQ